MPLARVAASLIAPERLPRPDLALAPAEWSALVAGLVGNKVPLLAVEQRGGVPSEFLASEVWRARRDQERQEHDTVAQHYALVHRALAQAGIRDVLIKSVGLPPSLPYQSDNLDILVAEQEGPRARAVLLDHHYVELKNVEEPSKFLFRKFHAGRSVSAIHLHEFVGWGTGFMHDAEVLARARPAPDDPELWLPAPEDALLITMAHAFYEDKAVKLGDLWKVMWLLRAPLDWEAIARQAEQRGWLDGLWTCVQLWAGVEALLYGGHSFPQTVVDEAQRRASAADRGYVAQRLASAQAFPLDISFRLSKRHYYGKVLRDPALTGAERARDIWKHSWAGVERRLPFQAQRGFLLALSGVDGAGKSAQAELLAQALDVCALHHRTVWSRGASSPLADWVIGRVKPLLARGGRLDTTSDTREAKVARKAFWLQKPLLRLGWQVLVVTDLVLRYAWRIAPQLAQGRVVIADRYTYDALVELSVLTARPGLVWGWAARCLRGLSPRPSLVVLLQVSLPAALARKPEEQENFLALQALLFDDMADRWPLVCLDADCGLEAVSDELVHRVLTAYYARWSGIKGWSWKRGR
jgi:thymidylate kinase